MSRSSVCKQTAKDDYGLTEDEIKPIKYSRSTHPQYFTPIFKYESVDLRVAAIEKYRCTERELDSLIGNKEAIHNKKQDLKDLKKSILEEAKASQKERERLNRLKLIHLEKLLKKKKQDSTASEKLYKKKSKNQNYDKDYGDSDEDQQIKVTKRIRKSNK